MSPRRKIDAKEPELYTTPAPKPPRRWGLPLVASVAAVLIAGAIAASTLMLVSHESDRKTQVRDADVLSYVRSFMTTYTTLDPYQANYYGDRIQVTGHRRLREDVQGEDQRDPRAGRAR